MASFDQGHHRYAQGLAKDPQPSTSNPIVPSDSDSSIPPLPAYAYTMPLAKRPKVSTSFEQNDTSVHTNGNSRSSSPDPHDFYRRHQERYRASLEGAHRQGDIRVEKRTGGMAAAGQRNGSVTTKGTPSKLPPLTSRINYRSNASPDSGISPLNATKSSPTLSNTARNRQTSLKDLVNKFNQTPDEALPLPKRSTSRSPSASSNRGNNVHIKARNSSLSKDQVEDHARNSSTASYQSLGNSRPHNRKGRIYEDPQTSPRSRIPYSSQWTDASRQRQYASQSTTNLGQHADDSIPRPLFGEIVGTNPSLPDPGFGIPKFRRRRGSEGSMHSPNPMFPQERGRQMHDVSPSSPSAWYLGVTPTLEEIKMEKSIPDLPANLHRRTRSDFIGAPSMPPTSNMYRTDLSPSRNPPSSPSSAATSKRSSYSRIPVSTARRQSTASDSGNSTQSTRAHSATGKSYKNTYSKPSLTLSKPQHIRTPLSPPRHSRSSTPQKSPRRGDFTSGIARPATSPRLAAYISAPMPKKSPPLRSSRPRQPVSNASTSASRARAVERFSGHENGSPRSIRETRPRKPPELAGVDFAARRQKIQQAVTKTVIEEERRDEQRRASMALSPASELYSSERLSTASEIHARTSQGESLLGETDSDQKEAQQEEQDHGPDRQNARSERELTINTGHLLERSVLDLSMEDSPTLGTYHRFRTSSDRGQEGDKTPVSDAEPSSAITAGTSDSVDTFFDDEPQDESQSSPRLSQHSQEHQALLNQIMALGDSSPETVNVRQLNAREKTPSEQDDRESIQIMLGETPVAEKGSFNEQYGDTPREPQLSEAHENRWSMSSWTSSNRSRDDREILMERIEEHSPEQPDQPAHLSYSTSATQQTPQPWSPPSAVSPRTARTTMDSDTYSTVGRVLDHYHDPNVMTPELTNDVQQYMMTQSPDLARQGGWDPKKVMQLYLQKAGRSPYSPTKPIADQVRSHIRPRTSSTKFQEVPEKEVRDDHDEKMIDSVEREDGEPTPPGTTLSVHQGDFKAARASLTGPDDWDMSPSLGGLEMQAEAIDSPSDEKPSLPPKNWRTHRNRELAEMPDRSHEKPRDLTDSHPQLPPIQGLGLDITVSSPPEDDSPVIPPPLPFQPPPPPPTEQYPHTKGRSPPSPSVYSKHVPSVNYPQSQMNTSDGIIPPIPQMPDIDMAHRSGAATPTSQHASSHHTVMPLDRSSIERPPETGEALSKASSPSPDQKRLTKRRHIIKELVDTEHSFSQDMKVVEDIYRATANVIVISPDELKTLFGNSDQIVEFSTTFLDVLKRNAKPVYVLAKSKRYNKVNRTSNPTSAGANTVNTDDQSSVNEVVLNDEEKDQMTKIGDAFSGDHMKKMEKVYTEYLKNHDAANQKLQILQENKKVQIWLAECRAYAEDLTTAWSLDSLLVKPVQRILKYPLLLDQLLDVTPENHPDFTALDIASREMKGMARRIDEMKKRADLMEQVNNTRKRKESDVRLGLSKAFGRRTEKLKQQVGMSEAVEDKVYSAISEKFGSHFFQLQVVMRDVEMYTTDVQDFVNRFCNFAMAIEAHVEVGQTSYPELESKWRKFRMSVRELSMTALTDHVAAVRKSVVEPMTTLLKLHDGPQKLMHKRNKRFADYARFKAIKDRGEKPDKKTIEQGEQFQAVNDTLKEELPKLFTLTAKLVGHCLNNFIQLQVQWQIVWKRKLIQAVDDHNVPSNAQEIVNAFTGDFAFFEAQVLSLGICNGSLLNDVYNQISSLSPSTTLDGNDASRQASTSDRPTLRTLSVSSDKSPVIPQPDFGGRGSGSGSFFGPLANNGRMRASSTLSGHSPMTPEIPGSYHSFSNNTTPVTSTPHRPSTATPRTNTEPSPAFFRSHADNPAFGRPSEDFNSISRTSGATNASSSASSHLRDTSDSQRYSGFFSSAMPMSDSPTGSGDAGVTREQPVQVHGTKEFNVLFLAASVYEFHIDPARKEAGYPYLGYVAGEVFDVIGEKGELWLAKNNDDPDNFVGWIWSKHFVKLAT